MRASLRRGVFALSAIFFLISTQQLPAQSSSGTITGSVTDSTGAVVPGATVTILNPVSGYTRTATKSDGSGSYQFQNIPFNPYHLTVKAAGFAPLAQDVEVKSPVVVKVTSALERGGSVDDGEGGENGGRSAGERLDDAYRHRPQPVPGAATGERDLFGEFAGDAVVAGNFVGLERHVSRVGRPCIEFVLGRWAGDHRPDEQDIF